MMKKQNFVNMINAVIDQQEWKNDISKALDPFMDSMFIYDIDSKFINSILEVLENEMGDIFNNISWWLYDAPEAGKCKDSAWIELKSGERITLETPEQLYDFLTGGY